MASKQEMIGTIRGMEGGRRSERNYVRLDRLIELVGKEWPADSGNMDELIHDFLIRFPDTIHHDIVVGVNDVLMFLKRYQDLLLESVNWEEVQKKIGEAKYNAARENDVRVHNTLTWVQQLIKDNSINGQQ